MAACQRPDCGEGREGVEEINARQADLGFEWGWFLIGAVQQLQFSLVECGKTRTK
jgi:hypothetical protein